MAVIDGCREETPEAMKLGVPTDFDKT